MNSPTITTIDKGKEPTLEEMQNIVGGPIEIVYDDGKVQIICNEEGKIRGLPYNEKATLLWWETLRVNSFYEHHNDVLVGDILILAGSAILK